MKSDILIKDDIYSFVKASPIMQAVSGKLSKTGVRPKGSALEDVVINVSANENGQIQDASVNVNVYVADDIKPDGQNQEASTRLRELCQICSDCLEVGHGADFRFTLKSQRVIGVDETKEHVINNKLIYKQVNDK